MNRYGSFRLGCVGVEFGGNCDCRYGIYVAGWFLCYRPKHVVLLCCKYHHLAIFIVVF